MLPICIGKTNISFLIYGCFGHIPAAAMDAFKKTITENILLTKAKINK